MRARQPVTMRAPSIGRCMGIGMDGSIRIVVIAHAAPPSRSHWAKRLVGALMDDSSAMEGTDCSGGRAPIQVARAGPSERAALCPGDAHSRNDAHALLANTVCGMSAVQKILCAQDRQTLSGRSFRADARRAENPSVGASVLHFSTPVAPPQGVPGDPGDNSRANTQVANEGRL